MNDVNPLRRLRAVPDDPAPDPGALLRAAGRGDEAAFADFYDAVSATVYGVVLRVVRDPGMAQDVTQEVFVELWRLAPRFEPGRGSARSWASTIAHRRAVDRVRSEQAHRDREAADASRSAVTEAGPNDVLETAEEHRAVREALDGLSQTQREAITLAYYGGHTYREVAALLDVPEGTVKTRIRDGLIKLRDHFGVGP